MNKIEKRFKSFLASVCVFAFYALVLHLWLHLNHRDLLRILAGLFHPTHYCSRTKMEIGMQYSKATYVLLTG